MITAHRRGQANSGFYASELNNFAKLRTNRREIPGFARNDGAENKTKMGGADRKSVPPVVREMQRRLNQAMRALS